jgi:hypothetical protein
VKLTAETRTKIERLASLTDEHIARIALDAAQRAFEVLVDNDVVIGANGDDGALHMRVGRAVDYAFEEWGERTLCTGSEFAKNTGQDGKAGTAAEFSMHSGDAFLLNGNAVGEGPRQYTGAAYVDVNVSHNDSYKCLDGAVGSSSGAQGPIDCVPSATAAQAVAGLVVLRDEARALLAAEHHAAAHRNTNAGKHPVAEPDDAALERIELNADV